MGLVLSSLPSPSLLWCLPSSPFSHGRAVDQAVISKTKQETCFASPLALESRYPELLFNCCLTCPMWGLLWQSTKDRQTIPKHTLPYGSASSALGICPNELKCMSTLKMYAHTRTCTWMFIAAKSTFAKQRNNQDVH